MKNKKGFTLVELLVVMAIIAILASIAIPNVINYIRGARATQALSEITSIETALTKMLSDAGRDSLHHLFNPQALANNFANGVQCVTNEDFQAATQIYSRTLYALLRDGRATMNNTDTFIGNYSSYLRSDVIRKLGTSYIDLEEDPWGNLYNIYPGNWRGSYNNNTIPFRIYQRPTTSDLPGSSGVNNMSDGDRALIWNVEDLESGIFNDVGFPASHGLSFYIWSNGENLQSSQALYNSGSAYDLAQGEDFAGGGDDINNWDNDASWAPFYN